VAGIEGGRGAVKGGQDERIAIIGAGRLESIWSMLHATSTGEDANCSLQYIREFNVTGLFLTSLSYDWLCHFR
jgi:hypothetical protein